MSARFTPSPPRDLLFPRPRGGTPRAIASLDARASFERLKHLDVPPGPPGATLLAQALRALREHAEGHPHAAAALLDDERTLAIVRLGAIEVHAHGEELALRILVGLSRPEIALPDLTWTARDEGALAFPHEGTVLRWNAGAELRFGGGAIFVSETRTWPTPCARARGRAGRTFVYGNESALVRFERAAARLLEIAPEVAEAAKRFVSWVDLVALDGDAPPIIAAGRGGGALSATTVDGLALALALAALGRLRETFHVHVPIVHDDEMPRLAALHERAVRRQIASAGLEIEAPCATDETQAIGALRSAACGEHGHAVLDELERLLAE